MVLETWPRPSSQLYFFCLRDWSASALLAKVLGEGGEGLGAGAGSSSVRSIVTACELRLAVGAGFERQGGWQGGWFALGVVVPNSC